MTTFWRPVTHRGVHTAIPAYRKQLGNGTYELWFRCDLCHKSDVFAAAYTWRNGLDDSQLCAACDAAPSVRADLFRDGWIRVP